MLRKEKVMHHGKKFGQFSPEYVGTDIFIFRHKLCRDRKAENDGQAVPKYLILDSDGKIVFHLKCLDCGFEDVLKTDFELWQTRRSKDYHKRILIESRLLDRLRGIKPWWPVQK
jgi:hypothetical protein